MKSVARFAIVGALLVAGFASAAAAPAAGKGKASAPGQAENFYRGITTIGSSGTTETVTNVNVLSSETETRTIGGGQFNNGKNGNGKDLSYTTVTETIVSDTTTTVVGDWGSAYDVPLDSK